METCGHFRGRRHWRCAWQTVRRLLFSGRGERARTRTREQFKGGAGRPNQNARLDGRADKKGSAQETGRDERQDRLSR